MRTLVVYEFRGDRYVALIGGSSTFKTKEQIFCSGEEKEIFSVSQPADKPFIELLRELIAEADKRGITTEIRCVEDILTRRQMYLKPPQTIQ